MVRDCHVLRVIAECGTDHLLGAEPRVTGYVASPPSLFLRFCSKDCNSTSCRSDEMIHAERLAPRLTGRKHSVRVAAAVIAVSPSLLHFD